MRIIPFLLYCNPRLQHCIEPRYVKEQGWTHLLKTLHFPQKNFQKRMNPKNSLFPLFSLKMRCYNVQP